MRVTLNVVLQNQMKKTSSGHIEWIGADSAYYKVLLPLLYFEIFRYPLSLEEVAQYKPDEKLSLATVEKTLLELVTKGWVFKIENYYLTQNEPDWVVQRRANNQRAEKYLKKAHFMTRLIRRFPFVRAVLVSGSLSKGVMTADGDIDYFIITQPNRLWVARTTLVLFKKLVLLNSHKYFCVNYFIDEQNLEIEEQNQFTATEVATLLPLYSSAHYQQFYAANRWIKKYYPSFPPRTVNGKLSSRHSKLQKSLEILLRGKWGDRLDRWFMKRTITYWNRKFKRMDPEQFAVALKSRNYVSKHHPQNFQNKVLKAFADSIERFEQKHQVQLEKLDSQL